jgi:hypothetical protein
MKWYVEQKAGFHATFTSLGKDLLAIFYLPICHIVGLEILLYFFQTTSTHIADHIQEWNQRISLCKVETTP